MDVEREKPLWGSMAAADMVLVVMEWNVVVMAMAMASVCYVVGMMVVKMSWILIIV